jgi:hypothetical protein
MDGVWRVGSDNAACLPCLTLSTSGVTAFSWPTWIAMERRSFRSPFLDCNWNISWISLRRCPKAFHFFGSESKSPSQSRSTPSNPNVLQTSNNLKLNLRLAAVLEASAENPALLPPPPTQRKTRSPLLARALPTASISSVGKLFSILGYNRL